MESNEMRLRVEYTGQLRSATSRMDDSVELPDGASITSLLEHLGERYGDPVRSHLMTTKGQIQRSLLVVVNGVAHAAGHAATIALRDNDCVEFLPPIGGG